MYLGSILSRKKYTNTQKVTVECNSKISEGCSINTTISSRFFPPLCPPLMACIFVPFVLFLFPVEIVLFAPLPLSPLAFFPPLLPPFRLLCSAGLPALVLFPLPAFRSSAPLPLRLSFPSSPLASVLPSLSCVPPSWWLWRPAWSRVSRLFCSPSSRFLSPFAPSSWPPLLSRPVSPSRLRRLPWAFLRGLFAGAGPVPRPAAPPPRAPAAVPFPLVPFSAPGLGAFCPLPPSLPAPVLGFSGPPAVAFSPPFPLLRLPPSPSPAPLLSLSPPSPCVPPFPPVPLFPLLSLLSSFPPPLFRRRLCFLVPCPCSPASRPPPRSAPCLPLPPAAGWPVALFPRRSLSPSGSLFSPRVGFLASSSRGPFPVPSPPPLPLLPPLSPCPFPLCPWSFAPLFLLFVPPLRRSLLPPAVRVVLAPRLRPPWLWLAPPAFLPFFPFPSPGSSPFSFLRFGSRPPPLLFCVSLPLSSPWLGRPFSLALSLSFALFLRLFLPALPVRFLASFPLLAVLAFLAVLALLPVAAPHWLWPLWPSPPPCFSSRLLFLLSSLCAPPVPLPPPCVLASPPPVSLLLLPLPLSLLPFVPSLVPPLFLLSPPFWFSPRPPPFCSFPPSPFLLPLLAPFVFSPPFPPFLCPSFPSVASFLPLFLFPPPPRLLSLLGRCSSPPPFPPPLSFPPPLPLGPSCRPSFCPSCLLFLPPGSSLSAPRSRPASPPPGPCPSPPPPPSSSLPPLSLAVLLFFPFPRLVLSRCSPSPRAPSPPVSPRFLSPSPAWSLSSSCPSPRSFPSISFAAAPFGRSPSPFLFPPCLLASLWLFSPLLSPCPPRAGVALCLRPRPFPPCPLPCLFPSLLWLLLLPVAALSFPFLLFPLFLSLRCSLVPPSSRCAVLRFSVFVPLWAALPRPSRPRSSCFRRLSCPLVALAPPGSLFPSPPPSFPLPSPPRFFFPSFSLCPSSPPSPPCPFAAPLPLSCVAASLVFPRSLPRCPPPPARPLPPASLGPLPLWVPAAPPPALSAAAAALSLCFALSRLFSFPFLSPSPLSLFLSLPFLSSPPLSAALLAASLLAVCSAPPRPPPAVCPPLPALAPAPRGACVVASPSFSVLFPLFWGPPSFPARCSFPLFPLPPLPRSPLFFPSAASSAFPSRRLRRPSFPLPSRLFSPSGLVPPPFAPLLLFFFPLFPPPCCCRPSSFPGPRRLSSPLPPGAVAAGSPRPARAPLLLPFAPVFVAPPPFPCCSPRSPLLSGRRPPPLLPSASFVFVAVFASVFRAAAASWSPPFARSARPPSPSVPLPSLPFLSLSSPRPPCPWRRSCRSRWFFSSPWPCACLPWSAPSCFSSPSLFSPSLFRPLPCALRRLSAALVLLFSSRSASCFSPFPPPPPPPLAPPGPVAFLLSPPPPPFPSVLSFVSSPLPPLLPSLFAWRCRGVGSLFPSPRRRPSAGGLFAALALASLPPLLFLPPLPPPCPAPLPQFLAPACFPFGCAFYPCRPGPFLRSLVRKLLLVPETSLNAPSLLREPPTKPPPPPKCIIPKKLVTIILINVLKQPEFYVLNYFVCYTKDL